MFTRKLKKLKKNPRLFFSDMYIKHITNFNKINKNSKYEGKYQYTIVSAAYNVEKYLDDFFKSIVNQSLSFKKHIKVIIVDDGSKDNTADLIKKWQKRYPKNIIYYYKENGGQAEARNFGLNYVDTDWVTFIDPDDFIDEKYFYHIDKSLSNKENIKIVSANFIPFLEDKNQFSDTHPLRYRFEKNESIYPCSDLDSFMQLTVNSVIFRADEIKNNQINFHNIKPNFEDGYFIADYLSLQKDGYMLFLKKARYFYRKRSDGSSTLDTSWSNKGRFSDVIVKGYLNSLKLYQARNSFVPVYFQRTILYDLNWYFKKIINKDVEFNFLNDEEKNNFISILKEIFEYIDDGVIYGFNMCGFWFYHKVGVLGLFKNTPSNYKICYIEDIDYRKKEFKVRSFSHPNFNQYISFHLDNGEVLPAHLKYIDHHIFNEVFVREQISWVPFDNFDQTLVVKINNKDSKITLQSKQYASIRLDKIGKAFPNKVKTKKNSIWIFSDRDISANDNAEHLYRYISNKRPENIEMYFVLSKKSSDWQRLENEGFNLVAFGSILHEDTLKSCDKIISSHADQYVTDYFKDGSLKDKDFVFLQHGVIKDDLSEWLNRRKIDFFVTTTLDEYNSICGNYNSYKFSTKEVKMTGLPRHDILIHRNNHIEKNKLVIMPTWRHNLAGKRTGVGTNVLIEEEDKLNFINSEYYIKWKSFLHSKELNEIHLNYPNLEICFILHPLLSFYIDLFSTPEFIKILLVEEVNFSDLILSTKTLITDYSSIAFDAAIINRSIIYYQFDANTFFSGEHVYKKGYFNYTRDGFGPVVEDEEQLYKELNKILNNDGKPDLNFQKRINSTFTLRDGNSCQRVYDAILELDKPNKNKINEAVYNEYANRAMIEKKWPLAEKYWCELYHLTEDEIKNKFLLSFMKTLGKQGKLSEALNLFNQNRQYINKENLDEYLREAAYLAMAKQEWELALEFWQQNLPENKIEDVIAYIKCLAELKKFSELDSIQEWVSVKESKELIKVFIGIWKFYAKDEWDNAINNINVLIKTADNEEIKNINLRLILAYCLYKAEHFEEVEKQLNIVEKNNDDIFLYNDMKIGVLFFNCQWNSVVSEIKKTYYSTLDTPKSLCIFYIKSLIELKNHDEAKKILLELPDSYIYQNIEFLKLKLNLIFKMEGLGKIVYEIQEIIDNFNHKNQEFYILFLPYIASIRKLGKLTIALELFDLVFGNLLKDDWVASIWREKARLEMAFHSWDKAIFCWKKILNGCKDLDILDYIKCLVMIKNNKQLEKIIDSEIAVQLDAIPRQIALAWVSIAHYNFNNAIDILNAVILSCKKNELNYYKPQLLLAFCFRNQRLFDKAEFILIEYNKNCSKDIAYYEQLIFMEIARDNWESAYRLINLTYSSFMDIPESFAYAYAKNLRLQKRFSEAEQAIQKFTQIYPNNLELMEETAELAFDCNLLKKSISIWKQLRKKSNIANIRLKYIYKIMRNNKGNFK